MRLSIGFVVLVGCAGTTRDAQFADRLSKPCASLQACEDLYEEARVRYQKCLDDCDERKADWDSTKRKVEKYQALLEKNKSDPDVDDDTGVAPVSNPTKAGQPASKAAKTPASKAPAPKSAPAMPQQAQSVVRAMVGSYMQCDQIKDATHQWAPADAVRCGNVWLSQCKKQHKEAVDQAKFLKGIPPGPIKAPIHIGAMLGEPSRWILAHSPAARDYPVDVWFKAEQCAALVLGETELSAAIVARAEDWRASGGYETIALCIESCLMSKALVPKLVSLGGDQGYASILGKRLDGLSAQTNKLAVEDEAAVDGVLNGLAQTEKWLGDYADRVGDYRLDLGKRVVTIRKSLALRAGSTWTLKIESAATNADEGMSAATKVKDPEEALAKSESAGETLEGARKMLDSKRAILDTPEDLEAKIKKLEARHETQLVALTAAAEKAHKVAELNSRLCKNLESTKRVEDMKQKQKIVDAKTGTRDIKLERQIEATLLGLEDQRKLLKKELAANGATFDAKKCPP